MTPAPTLTELIESVRADAPSDDPLDQLHQAAQTAATLEHTGDALLGHFVDQSRASGYSWSQISGALGVTKQAVHKRYSAATAAFEPGSPAFERFTPRAKAALQAAAEGARRRGRANVESDDLLLALFEPAQSVAAQVLREAGLTREGCERALGTEPTGDGLDDTERPPFGESAKNVLRRAVERAQRLGHNYVGTEHLLLGVYDDARSGDRVTEALVELGLTYEIVSARIADKLDELVGRLTGD